MARECLRKATKTASRDAGDVRETVQKMLDEIEAGREAAAKRYAERFDRYAGNLVLDREEIAAAGEQLPQRLKDAWRATPRPPTSACESASPASRSS